MPLYVAQKESSYTIEELKDILAKQHVDVEVKSKRRKKADAIWFQSGNNMLRDVNDDEDVRRLIHNMMEMDGGTMMKNITSVCVGMFTERYIGMKPNDWRHLIDDYVRKVTNRPDLKEDILFRYKVG